MNQILNHIPITLSSLIYVAFMFFVIGFAIGDGALWISLIAIAFTILAIWFPMTGLVGNILVLTVILLRRIIHGTLY